MAQSWSEFVNGLLLSSARVDKAAVFSSGGQPLAASDGLEVSDKDGRAILHCLRDPARTLTRITVDETDFRCFQGNGDALVGMATSGSGRVLVARVAGEEGVVVVVMGAATSKGSFLFEVQQSLVERMRRQRAPQRQISGARGEASQQQVAAAPTPQQQQQQQQPKKLIMPPPPSSPVNQEQVLVQIHD